MGQVLQGQLSDGVLANLLQFISMNMGTGCLLLRHPQGAQGYVFFEAGEILHLSLGQAEQSGVITDTAALAVLLGWQEGRFEFRHGVPSPVRSMSSSLSQALLEASTRKDELMRDGNAILFADSILQARLGKDSSVNVSIRGLKVLKHFDGHKTLADLARLLDMPIAEVILAAQELHRQELVELQAVDVPGSFMQDLRRHLTQRLGPIANVIFDETLDNLGISSGKLPTRLLKKFLGQLKAQLSQTEWQQHFDTFTTSLCRAYDLQP